MAHPTTLFVTITLTDSDRWPALAARATHLGATAAVLQGDAPTMISQLDALAAAGHRCVLIAPVTWDTSGVSASWVGRVARWWLGQRPDDDVEVLIARELLRTLPDALPSPGDARTLRPNEETLTNPTWADPPPIHTQVLLCRGPRCAAKGADAAGSALVSELYRRAMLDDQVLVTLTGCLYPCNRAPVVALQPQMNWRTLQAEDAAALADEIEDYGRRASERPS